ncbi:unnamed protein product [Blumeria hordei]|uniref:Uncharacterized protein n=2 Tax=Blumeria hordei TaxID=2867405 RepID=A0A383URK0_BLUHO|nr:CSEP0320 putative effector protein [Blumeria hordei DH14]SZF02517.1 unnamed protein product [Blumeria hordei]
MFPLLFLLYLGLPFVWALQAPGEAPSTNGVSKISATKNFWLKYPLPFSTNVKERVLPISGIECLEWPIHAKEVRASLSAASQEVKASKAWFSRSKKKGNFVSTSSLQPTPQKLYMYPMYELDIDSKGDIGPAPYLITSENGRSYAIYMVTGGNTTKGPKNPKLRYHLCYSNRI